VNRPVKENALLNAPYQKVFNTAIRILTRRDHSEYELTQKLKQRGFERDVISRVISDCARLNYLNDERTAEVFIRQSKRRGYGKKRIQIELNRKGLKGERITDILYKSVSESDEREAAKRVLKKNLKKFEREKDPLKRRNKIYRLLYTKGISEGIITDFVQRFR